MGKKRGEEGEKERRKEGGTSRFKIVPLFYFFTTSFIFVSIETFITIEREIEREIKRENEIALGVYTYFTF